MSADRSVLAPTGQLRHYASLSAARGGCEGKKSKESAVKKHLLFATIAAGFAVGLIGAPIASADDEGFLNELRSNGFPGLTLGDQQLPDGVVVANGWMACNRLRLGEKPEQTLAQVNPNDADKGRMLINAAQHHLCPDTL
nr:DUF732 domain-containing protein [Mycobacterium sp. UM_NZ2]